MTRRAIALPDSVGRICRAGTALICLLMAATFVEGRVRRSQAWVDEHFNKAEAQRETLEGRVEHARTRRQYETVIASYRRITFEAPTSSKADGSAFMVAQLTAEMGRQFKDDMALYSAVREYKYLRREYPGSKHRMDALLAIGEIYKNDLDDRDNARATFEEFLRRYQHSGWVEKAREELAVLKMEDAPSRSSTSQNSEMTAENSHQGGDSDDTARDPDHGPGAREKTGGQKSVAADAAESGAAEAPVAVRAVDYRSAEEYTRITVELEQDVQFKSQRIARPERIFFDLKNARLTRELTGTTVDVNDGRVRKIRAAQYSPGLARIVIETDGRASYNASLALNPARLVIDVHGEGNREDSKCADDDDCAANATRPPAVSVSEKAGVKKVIVEADPDPPSHDSDDAPAAKPSARSRNLKSAAKDSKPEVRAVPLRGAQPASGGERSLTRTLGLKIGKIVIDPGHGGHDAGTVGLNGLLEKDLVLDVSRRLGKLLSARMGAEVVFTRRDDTFIPLETRTAIANQEQADLFVSVHANSSQDPDASGVETYYLNFTSSPEALEVAARENAASDKSIHELQDLVKKIALKEKIEESHEFASDVQQSLHRGLARRNPGERDRGVKQAPFVVLIGANMPSILAEISFLSNPGEERRLRAPEYRQRIAESLFRGIERYVNGLGGLKVASRMEKAPAE